MNPDELLRAHFGFDTFRPGQREVIEALDSHQAALAVFPTGGGKSLCYQLPALAYEGVTLVVSPLVALMKDQVDFLARRGVAAARLDSSLSADETRQITTAMQSGALRLLYVAPERFNNERFLAALGRTRISLFAVDEAHCISEWGHNFRPDYLKLAETAREVAKAERILALTATATPEVAADIRNAFAIPEAAYIHTGFYRPNLNVAVTAVRGEERDVLLLKRFQSRKPGTAIVYVTLQKEAERVAALLAGAGFSAKAYHAGMESDERTAVQEWWAEGDTNIVVATIAFGMGIDKASVRYVYHANLPKSLESYSQEIGRAGRDGLKSTVELFASAEDAPALQNFAYGDTPSATALHALIDELLSRSSEFDVDLYDLSARFDLRPLVLRTALTYLELGGALRQGTPFYAGYQVRLTASEEEVFGAFPGEPGRFLRDVFGAAKRGRIWYTLNPETVAETLGKERRRVVRALEVLEERGLAELRPGDPRQKYARLASPGDAERLAAELAERFAKREANEIARVGGVLAFVEHEGCLTNALVGHFGEVRPAPCGHCSYCATGRAQKLPPPLHHPPLPDGLDTASFDDLRAAHPEALSEARQAARFLCGLSSPAATKAKLNRHSLYGACETRPFSEVLAWCSAN